MNKKIIISTAIIIVVMILFVQKEFVVAPSISSSAATSSAKSATLNGNNHKKGTIVVGENTFNTIVSDTEALRSKGLSGRTGLEADQAMIFVFDSPDMLGFWMKDMFFSIDMLWLDAESRIVSFEKNVSPDTYPKVFFPTSPSLYVIEFSAGTLDKIGISKGEYIQINL